jgi:hypothetical protein
MKAKLSIVLLATLGLPVLLASALAQQQAAEPTRSRSQEPERSARLDAFRGNQGGNLAAFTFKDTGGSSGDDLQPEPGSSVSIQAPNSGSFSFSSRQTRNGEATLARAADELSRKLGGAKSETDRSQIKTQLTEVLEKQFELRQKRHQDEIAGLEAKVKKLKDLVEKRQENRREIVSKRVDQIVRDAEGLGW